MQAKALATEMEAPSGFEPLNRSFADCSLSHLGTAPLKLNTLYKDHMFLLGQERTTLPAFSYVW
jgi:hypothetical protein